MKKQAILMLIGALLISGCSKTTTTTYEEGNTGASNVQEETTGDRMKKEVGEALDATGEYFTEQRDKAIVEIQQAKDKLDAKVNNLKTERETAEPERKNRIDIEIRGLEDERAKLDEMGDKVKAATQEGWENVKQGWNDLKNTEVNVKTSSNTDNNR